ncbi:MAG: type II secretion system F family protein, partial [Patescibacteria group bacterium]
MVVNLSPKTNEAAAEKDNSSLMQKINGYLLKLSRVPLKEKLFFVQHLGIMLKAGISLSVALKTLADQSSNKLFEAALTGLAADVEKGKGFSESLKPYENIFGELFINMIEAGELSGKLENVLEQLYIQMKKQHELTGKVKGALTYPAVIIFAMGGIGVFMMIFVVPKITEMLKSFNAELPLATRILIGLSEAIINNGIITLIVLAILITTATKAMHTYKGKYIFQTLVLKMPIISPIIKKINLARFSRTISALLKTDIAIIKSFQITANVLGNLHYRNALLEMAERIKKGGQINEVIKTYPKLFPPTVAQMIAIGEQTGELDNILQELAGFYEGEVDQVMNNLPSI